MTRPWDLFDSASQKEHGGSCQIFASFLQVSSVDSTFSPAYSNSVLRSFESRGGTPVLCLAAKSRNRSLACMASTNSSLAVPVHPITMRNTSYSFFDTKNLPSFRSSIPRLCRWPGTRVLHLWRSSGELWHGLSSYLRRSPKYSYIRLRWRRSTVLRQSRNEG